MILVYSGFFFWILLWSSTAGTTSFGAWGLGFALTIIQDVFVNQLGLLSVVHVVAAEIMRPQLKHIYDVLNNAAMRTAGVEVSAEQKGTVVQHFSPSCRAARAFEAFNLHASLVLRFIDDYDVALCRENRYISLGVIAFVIVAIPTIFAAVSYPTHAHSQLVFQS